MEEVACSTHVASITDVYSGCCWQADRALARAGFLCARPVARTSSRGLDRYDLLMQVSSASSILLVPLIALLIGCVSGPSSNEDAPRPSNQTQSRAAGAPDLPMIWLWSPASMPVDASGNPAFAHVEPMVWFRPGQADRAIDQLRAKPTHRRAMFVWHPENHDPDAWAADRTTRVTEGAKTEAGYRYWRSFFERARSRGVDGLAEIVVDYEGGGRGLKYWQMSGGGKIGQTVDYLKDLQRSPKLDARSPIASLRMEGVSKTAHSTPVYTAVNQHVEDLINAWLRDTIARAYEDVFGSPPRISNYGNAATPWPDINDKLNPVGTINGTSAPVMYLRPNRMTRQAYLRDLLTTWQQEPAGSAAWVSPGFRGDDKGFEMPDELDERLAQAVAAKAGSIVLWTSDAWLQRDAGETAKRQAEARQRAAARLLAEAVLDQR